MILTSFWKPCGTKTYLYECRTEEDTNDILSQIKNSPRCTRVHKKPVINRNMNLGSSGTGPGCEIFRLRFKGGVYRDSDEVPRRAVVVTIDDYRHEGTRL